MYRRGYRFVSGKKLAILDSKCEVLQQIVVPRFLCSTEEDGIAYCINSNHGRSVYLGNYNIPCLGNDKRHVFAKGIGLTLGITPYLYLPEFGNINFGFCSNREAHREWKHSNRLAKLGITTGRVIGIAQIDEIPYSPIMDSNKIPENVKPCVVYSATRALHRVGDIPYLPPNERSSVLKLYQDGLGAIDPSDFFIKFISIIAENSARLHENGRYNRTIYAHNITCLGEVVDFEAISVPLKPRTSQIKRVTMLQRLEIYNSLQTLVDVAELFGIEWDLPTLTYTFVRTYIEHTTQRAALTAVIPEKLWNFA